MIGIYLSLCGSAMCLVTALAAINFFYSLFILEDHSKIVGHVLYAPLISSKPEIVTVNILFLIYVYMDGFGICLWKHVKWEVIAKPCRKGDGPRRGDVQAVVH